MYEIFLIDGSSGKTLFALRGGSVYKLKPHPKKVSNNVLVIVQVPLCCFKKAVYFDLAPFTVRIIMHTLVVSTYSVFIRSCSKRIGL